MQITNCVFTQPINHSLSKYRFSKNKQVGFDYIKFNTKDLISNPKQKSKGLLNTLVGLVVGFTTLLASPIAHAPKNFQKTIEDVKGNNIQLNKHSINKFVVSQLALPKDGTIVKNEKLKILQIKEGKL